MEEQIKNLLTLSEKYIEYSVSQGHSEKWKEYGDVDVYISGTVKAVSFNRDKIEVMKYTNSIRLPLNATAEYIQAVYEDASNYLEKLKK